MYESLIKLQNLWLQTLKRNIETLRFLLLFFLTSGESAIETLQNLFFFFEKKKKCFAFWRNSAS
jgi:hypothetical protein